MKLTTNFIKQFWLIGTFLVAVFGISSCAGPMYTKIKPSFQAIPIYNLQQIGAATPYKRKNWKHWIDADKDCQDTRQETLIRDGKEIAYKSSRRCKVQSGVWHDPYSGKQFHKPRALDIDHMVPLKEAWRSGGHRWDKNRKKDYANDLQHPEHLLAVHAKYNRQKGARAPDMWMPPNAAYHCKYLYDWVQIKARWHLAMRQDEKIFIQKKLYRC